MIAKDDSGKFVQQWITRFKEKSNTPLLLT